MAHSTKVDGKPGFYWFPKDWMGAADIGLCSYAARGLWMELLNLMWLSPKRGYLLMPNNNKPDNKIITKLTRGDDYIETGKLLEELKQNNVYSITEDGCIYCRIMVDRAKEEEHIKQVRSEAGFVGMSKRWHNKTITKVYNKRITNPERERVIETEIEIDKSKEIEEIINYLNLKTGKHYKLTTPKTKDFINLRMAEGFSVQNFKTVIDIKTAEWGKDPKMAQYLRPDTLFGTKFEGYLNQKHVKSELEQLANYQEPE